MKNRTQTLARWMGMAAVSIITISVAQADPLATVERNGSFVAIEPYAPNIVRVTIALDPNLASGAPGPGPNAPVDATGWTHRVAATGDIFSSSALSLTVAAQPWPKAPTQMERYFAPSLPPVEITINGADGHVITHMTGWEMAPHMVAGEKTFKVGASFSAPLDEH